MRRRLQRANTPFTGPPTDGNLALRGWGEGGGTVATQLRLLPNVAQARPELVAFERAERRRNLSPKTIVGRHRTLKALTTWAERRGMSLTACTHEDVENWLDGCRLSARSRSTYLASVTAFYAWCVEVGHLDANPVDQITRPRVGKTLPRPIATGDLAKALENSTGRMKVWLCLGAFQGLRTIEMQGLERLDVLDGESPQSLVVRNGKGRKQRVLPLHADTLSAIGVASLPARGPLFRLQDGRPMSSATIGTYISRFLHALDINASAHMLRHWFGTMVYKATKDLLLVRDLMGHEDVKTTTIYTKLVAKDSAIDAVLGLKV